MLNTTKGFHRTFMDTGGSDLAWHSILLTEIVSPVVEGSVRARQDSTRRQIGNKVVQLLFTETPLLQAGVVMETCQCLRRVLTILGGHWLHIISNNQVGLLQVGKKMHASYLSIVLMLGKNAFRAPIFHVEW